MRRPYMCRPRITVALSHASRTCKALRPHAPFRRIPDWKPPTAAWKPHAASLTQASPANSTHFVSQSRPGVAQKMPLMRSRGEMQGIAEKLLALDPRPMAGRVVRVLGTTIEAILPDAHIGQLCRLSEPLTRQAGLAE